ISFRARLWSLAAATAAAAAPCPVRRVPPTIQSASLTRFVEHASLGPVVVMAACLKGCLEHCSGCMYGYLSQLYAPRKVNAPLATSETRKSGPSDFFDWGKSRRLLEPASLASLETKSSRSFNVRWRERV
ncbi:unnamed protein product, partial [Ixodes persulcatus]